MSNLLQDLRYSFRMMLKNPGFTAVALLSIAVGISANTTVFTWVDSILLHPLQGVAQSEQLVTLETVAPSGQYIDSSYLDYKDYRDQTKSISGLIAFQERPLVLGEDQETERLWAQFVSGNFFDALGVKPAAGRFFLPEEQAEKPGAYPVAVISSNLYKRRFHGDPSVLGKTIVLNRQKLTLVGVAPEEFAGAVVGLSFDVYVPLMMERQLNRSGDWITNRKWRHLHLIARLKAGVNIQEAQSEINAISGQLALSYPNSNLGLNAALLPIWKAPYGAQSQLSLILRILLCVGGIVLLIVCANVANLLLARAAGRQKEISIRLAIGASRNRLIQQLLTESLLLAVIGGAIGILLAAWMTELLRFFTPSTNLPLMLTSGVNRQALGFTFILSLATGVIFGLAPALQSTKPDLNSTLKECGRTSSAGSNRTRAALVISEVALALITLIGAGLFFNSFQKAKDAHTGFDPENVLLAGFNLSSSGYDREQGKEFYRRLRERIETMPGVKAVSYAEDVPLGFEGGSWEDLEIEGYTPRPDDNMKIYRNIVSTGYFNLMGIPLLEGRDFTEQDDEKAPLAAIVNETFAQRFLGGRNPIGSRFKGWGRTLTIIGVAKNIKYQSLSESRQPYFYVPFLQFYRAGTGIALHVRTDGPPQNILSAVQREVRSLDGGLSIFDSMSLTDYIGASYFAQKVAATLLSVLGALAVLLAALGLYSVVSYWVTQSRHEIGIRMALGAQRSDVVKLVLGRGMIFAATGVALGLAASFILTRWVSSLLYEVSASDLSIYAIASLSLAAITLFASYIPARSAAKTDPMIALRHD